MTVGGWRPRQSAATAEKGPTMAHRAGYTDQPTNARSQHVGNGLAVAGLVCGLVGCSS